ncbi:MAG: hypothetical protein ACLQEQ_09740 [Nitrososphaerales archaeon]
MKLASFVKKNLVFFVAIVILTIWVYHVEPPASPGAAEAVAYAGAAAFYGAVLASIPWGISKVIVRIMRKPSYPV